MKGERGGRVEAPAFVLEVQSHYANEIKMAKSQGLRYIPFVHLKVKY